MSASAPGLAVSAELRAGLAAGLASFGRKTRARGAGYARDGRVRSISVGESSIEATVLGSDEYRVEWRPRGQAARGAWIATCTCPVGTSCKHAAAVAEVVLDGHGRAAAAPRDRWEDADLDAEILAELDAILGDERRGAPWARAPRRAAHGRRLADAVRRLRESPRSWERSSAAAALFERAGLSRHEVFSVLPATALDDPEPDVRCWRLTGAIARLAGPAEVPEPLRPYLDRPDLEQLLLARERDGLRRDLVHWISRLPTGQRRSLRLLLHLEEGVGRCHELSLEVRLASARGGERARSASQLRQLRVEVRNAPETLAAEQAALLALLVEDDSDPPVHWSRSAPVIALGSSALQVVLEQAARSSLVTWHGDLDPELADRAGVAPGAPVRLSAQPVRIVPDCATRDGATLLELSVLWSDGRRAALDDVVCAGSGASRYDREPAFVVAGGEIAFVSSAPPATLIQRFAAARGLPLSPAERVPLLSMLAGRWPNLRDTLATHTRLVPVEPVLTLDLRDDDWLQLRLFARRRDAEREATSEARSGFELRAGERWSAVETVSVGSALALADAVPAHVDATAEATGGVPAAEREPTAEAWIEVPDPSQMQPALDWLGAIGAAPGARPRPGGGQPPWADRDVGLWLRLTSRRVGDFFAQWQRRPAGVAAFGNERARRLLAPPVRALPRVRVAASGVDFLAVAAQWEVEASELSPEEVAALRAATTRFVRLRSGWVQRPEAEDHDAERALADLGIEVGGGEQRVTLWQLAGARAESLAALEAVGADAQTIAAVRELRDRIASFRGLPRVASPRSLRAKLRPYQRDGLDFLAFAAGLGTGAILADDMGLGKTLQTLAWLEHLRRRDPAGGPALVVCPASVVHNWRREAERFAPSMRVLVLERGAGRHALRAEVASHDLVIMNYALLRRDARAWQEIELRAAILDEAQNVKNPDAAVTRAACALRARHRVALTGTPLENRPLDVFSIASFVCPGYLGSRARFVEGFDRPELPASRRALLAAKLRPILLRRLKADVARDLPERIEERRDCDLTPGQRRLYLAELARSRELVARLGEEADGLRRNRIAILAALTRLRQICCHPALAGGKPELGSGKLDGLFEILEPLAAEGHKVLVFSQFVACLRIIAGELAARGIAHHVLTGETADREAVLRRFAEDARPAAFLLSLKAGGTGLNLTAASYVVLFDPWWNPAVEAQAIDRSHRIGQHRTVIAYRLIARGTIEEKIAELQERKSSLVRAVLGDGGAARGLTREDLEVLLAPPQDS